MQRRRMRQEADKLQKMELLRNAELRVFALTKHVHRNKAKQPLEDISWPSDRPTSGTEKIVSNQLLNQGPKHFKISHKNIETLKRNKYFRVNTFLSALNRTTVTFTCLWDDCDMVFTRHLNMINHLRKHTGERPYSCHFCEQKFT
jgi:hypothetical protein